MPSPPADDPRSQHSVLETIAHRTGALAIGDASVVIAVSSPHRAEAFEACRYAIETLKKMAPIWKEEFYETGKAWISG